MKKEIALKSIKIFLETFFGIVVALFVAFFIMSKVSSSPLFVFNKTTMWVMTDSMDPTIAPKSYILVEKITADDAEKVYDGTPFEVTANQLYYSGLEDGDVITMTLDGKIEQAVIADGKFTFMERTFSLYE